MRPYWRRLRLLLTIFAAGVLVAACGDGSSGSSSASNGGGGTNQAPTISGKPQAQTMQGSQYSFTPSASDPDGDTLTFSVSNLPSWATFDASTGKISGTPSSGDIGTYQNITITASDGQQTSSLGPFTIDVVATSTGSATLSWTAPSQNTDGSPLTDLAGYKIYWGTTKGNYTHSVTLNNPGLTSYVIDQLTPATWYFVATAFDSQGVESAFSNAASKTVN